MVGFFYEEMRGGTAYSSDFNADTLRFQVSYELNIIRIPRHDNDGVYLVGNLNGVNRKGYVCTFMAWSNRAMIKIM